MWFRAVIVDRDGVTSQVRRSGADEGDVRRTLDAEQLRVLSLQPDRQWFSARKHSSAQIDVFCSSIASLLDAGLPVVQAIEVHREAGSGGELDEQLVRSLRQGAPLSEALSQSASFDPLLVAMVRASERSGSVAAALRQYARYCEASQRFRRRVVGALTYPAILAAAGIAVTAFLSFFVVPRFAETLRGAGHTVPGASAVLFALSDWVAANAVPCIAAIGIGAALLVIHARRTGLASIVHRVAMLVPGVRGIVHDAAIARLFFTTGTLLQGGLPLLPALVLAGPVLPVPYRQRLTPVVASLEAGERMSVALRQHGLDTPTTRRLLEAAERSGSMQTMLLECARHEEQRIEHRVTRLLQVAEPTLLALIGLVVGTVVVLLYLPIFELVQWTQ
jgi:general secretion pathway protein F